MNRVEKYITIQPFGESPTGKTKVWRVINHKEVPTRLVGWIKWHGAWRKYCYFIEYDEPGWTVHDSDCMRLISDFLDEKNGEHRESLSFRPKRH